MIISSTFTWMKYVAADCQSMYFTRFHFRRFTYLLEKMSPQMLLVISSIITVYKKCLKIWWVSSKLSIAHFHPSTLYTRIGFLTKWRSVKSNLEELKIFPQTPWPFVKATHILDDFWPNSCPRVAEISR